MQKDTDRTLEEIHRGSSAALVAQMLEIQRHRISHNKSEEWATHLQFLRISDPSSAEAGPGRKRRRLTSGESLRNSHSLTRTLWRTHWSEKPYEKNYVAISYARKVSEDENPHAGGYTIRSRKGDHQSNVRDVVFERAVHFAKEYDASLIWIDQECMDQRDSEEREIGMQSMDMVYSRSSLPLGLLSVSIESQEHLDLLSALLCGDLIQHSRSSQRTELKRSVDNEKTLRVLEVLCRITSDEWWERAWIYQEEYRTSGRMCLLIRHAEPLTKGNDFGDIPGELEVNSVDFRTATTKFLLACDIAGHQYDKSILRKTKQYNITNQFESSNGDGRVRFKAMSPTILSDIQDREIGVVADSLAIIANCCHYPIRLDTQRLSRTDFHLSTCMLVLCLLNGEILSNNQSCEGRSAKAQKSLLSYTIHEYLHKLSMDDIEPPVCKKQLTFIKRCRLVDVTLSKHGIETTGWLWELGEEVDTSHRDFKEKFWYKIENDPKESSLDSLCRARL
ncbi:hypothetical protein MMC24_002344 [Lignoscripta atroalba]|nr:hypothetical protein [Lignoscripta atroalba]